MSQARAVLIVDDDRDMLALLDDLLSGEGYKVVKAKSGAEATAAIAKSRPDLVMIDVLLPDEDGLSLLAQIKREHPELYEVLQDFFQQDPAGGAPEGNPSGAS